MTCTCPSKLRSPSSEEQVIEVLIAVGIVVAVDEPDVCLAADRRELNVQRSLRLQVAQHDDGFWPYAFDSFKHRREVAMRIPEEEDLGGLSEAFGAHQRAEDADCLVLMLAISVSKPAVRGSDVWIAACAGLACTEHHKPNACRFSSVHQPLPLNLFDSPLHQHNRQGNQEAHNQSTEDILHV